MIEHDVIYAIGFLQFHGTTSFGQPLLKIYHFNLASVKAFRKMHVIPAN